MPSSSVVSTALLHFPTRRSSDLQRSSRRESAERRAAGPDTGLRRRTYSGVVVRREMYSQRRVHQGATLGIRSAAAPLDRSRGRRRDRKSTRLNSSHLVISYAVFFCRLHCPPPFPYTTLFRSPALLPTRERGTSRRRT